MNAVRLFLRSVTDYACMLITFKHSKVAQLSNKVVTYYKSVFDSGNLLLSKLKDYHKDRLPQILIV